jgi:ATP-dependent DNA helicase RecQ
VDARTLNISKENYTLLKRRTNERKDAVIHYVESTHKCRSQLLLSYFGENNTVPCEQCDVCLEEKRKVLHTDEFENISEQIRQLLSVHPMELSHLVMAVSFDNEDKIIHTIQWLIDNKKLKYNNENQLILA